MGGGAIENTSKCLLCYMKYLFKLCLLVSLVGGWANQTPEQTRDPCQEASIPETGDTPPKTLDGLRHSC